MPGKIIATYLARITVRDPQDWPEGVEQTAPEPPTLDELDLAIETAVHGAVAGHAEVHVSSERVDD